MSTLLVLVSWFVDESSSSPPQDTSNGVHSNAIAVMANPIIRFFILAILRGGTHSSVQRYEKNLELHPKSYPILHFFVLRIHYNIKSHPSRLLDGSKKEEE